MVIPIRPLAATVLLSCGLLTACGGSSSSASSSSSSSSSTSSAIPSPVAGTPFSSAKFTTVVPTNWTDKSTDQTEVAKFSSSGTVMFLVEQGPPGTQQKDVNDVNANVNVIALNTPVPDDQVAAYLSSVTNHGATNLSSPQQFTLDGATGQFVTYDQDVQGTPGESQDMVINHGGTTYDIVFNDSQFAFQAQMPGLTAVLAAWKWTS